MVIKNVRKRTTLNEGLNRVLAGFISIILVKPDYFRTLPMIDGIYDGLCVLIAFSLILFGVLSRPLTKSRIWIFTFYGLVFLITIFSSGDVVTFMRQNCASLAMCLFFDIWLTKEPQILIDSSSILELLIYINLITILMFPEGMYKEGLYSQNWFLGYKNVQIRTILPIVCISTIRSYFKYEKINLRTFALIVCAGITMALIDSATALIGFIVFCSLFLLYHSKKRALPRIFSLWTGVIAVVVGFIAIVEIRIQDLFADFFNDVLNRSITFTGRISIWEKSITLFLKRPVFGYGYLTSDEYVSYYGAQYATHPHNCFLYC